MIILHLWTAIYPSWMTDDLSYYLTYRFYSDRAANSLGHDMPSWVLSL